MSSGHCWRTSEKIREEGLGQVHVVGQLVERHLARPSRIRPSAARCWSSRAKVGPRPLPRRGERLGLQLAAVRSWAGRRSPGEIDAPPTGQVVELERGRLNISDAFAVAGGDDRRVDVEPRFPGRTGGSNGKRSSARERAPRCSSAAAGGRSFAETERMPLLRSRYVSGSAARRSPPARRGPRSPAPCRATGGPCLQRGWTRRP